MAEEEQEEKASLISKVVRILPSVEKPTYKQTFNTKLMWTGVALVLYIMLSHISVFGIGKTPELEALLTIQTLLGAKFGSMMTLGIGPIVTAGILLQLLTGSKIINWDMSDPENRKKFQAWNKFLAILLCFIEGIAFVMAGALPVSGGPAIFVLVILQLAAGGIIVIMLDDLVQKWGFGSGISLFIAAGVATQIFITIFSPFADPRDPGYAVGYLMKFIVGVLNFDNLKAMSSFVHIAFTGVVFAIVMYAQDIRIEIPLSFSSMRGFGRTWPLKLFYTSNIPVILAAALLANMQLIGTFSVGAIPQGETACGMLGCFDSNKQPLPGGVIYYLTAPRNLVLHALSIPFPGIAGNVPFEPSEIVRAVTYLIFLAAICTLFSVFWVSTSGMDSGSVAEQIEKIGMQIPGYRSDKRTIEGVLNRYIPPLAVLGGLLIGVLAAFADFTGAIGTGTGILLTVSIVYQYYEQLSAERLEEAHPIVRKILGEE